MSAEAVRILVVDDEPGMREGCRKILISEGFEVETAEDGQAGLEKFLAKRDFAAALVDIKMPRMGGIELIENIRKLDEDIVLLVITAYATIDTAVEATKRGAYGYIPKPFTPDEMLMLVRNGLERRTLSLEAKRLRREREDRLLEVAYERTKSSAILKCMTDGVLVINRDRQIVMRNAAAARCIPGGDLLSIPSPLGGLACAELAALVKDALDAEGGPRIVSREMALDECTFMVNVSPIPDAVGRPAGAVAVLRDITALKKLETAKSMFVSMVAHEVKRPLGVIEGYISLILSGRIKEREKELEVLDKSLTRARTLRILVSDLMNLTALETGRFVVNRAPTDLRDVLIKSADACREKAEERGTSLVMEIGGPGEFDKALADPEAMCSVFTNLIDNAVKYTPDGGRVVVRLANAGNDLAVSVRDNGIGMSPEEKQKLFQEFYRAHNAQTAKVPGAGLGLALVKRLVDTHQGKITVKTAPGEGSIFTVFLSKAEGRS